MRVYLSYPMTNASSADVELRHRVRAHLEGMGVETYDPERDEPGGLSMREIQEWDYARMGECDALLVIWSNGASSSGGVLAEIEWARRVFAIPVCLYRPYSFLSISPWTLESAGGNVREELVDAVRLLRGLSEAEVGR